MKAVSFKPFLIVVLVLGLSASQAVAAPLVNCEQMLRAARAFTPTELVNLSTTTDTDMSVTISRSLKGEAPTGQLLNLNRIGEDWDSTYMSEPNAPQGDPRRLAIILGGEVAHFLGVSIVSDQKMLAPDAFELNHRIEKLNKLLIKKGYAPIPLRFANADAKTVDAESFNRDFALNFSLPYAVLSALTIHDLAYHVPAIVFPSQLLNGYQSAVNAIYRFSEHLKARGVTAKGKNKDLYNWTRIVLLDESSQSLDVSSGNLAVAYATVASFGDDFSIEEKIMLNGDAVENEVLRFFGRAENPTIESIMIDRIQRLVLDSMYVDSTGNMAFTEEEIEIFLRKELTRFKKENPDIAFKASLGTFTTEALIEAFDKRVAEIKEALK